MITIKIRDGFAVKGNFKNGKIKDILVYLILCLLTEEWHETCWLSLMTIREKVNNTNWRVYIAEEMLNWVDPIGKGMESDDNNHFFGDYFPVSLIKIR